jgi:hypothetical protein
MISQKMAGIKRAWSVPRLVPHESLVLLSQSFLGLAPAGVNFDLIMMPPGNSGAHQCQKHNPPPWCGQ